jgi:hypothetical protein
MKHPKAIKDAKSIRDVIRDTARRHGDCIFAHLLEVIAEELQAASQVAEERVRG